MFSEGFNSACPCIYDTNWNLQREISVVTNPPDLWISTIVRRSNDSSIVGLCSLDDRLVVLRDYNSAGQVVSEYKSTLEGGQGFA